MDRIRSYRGASLAIAVLFVVITSSQFVDFRRLGLVIAGFSIGPVGEDVSRLAPVTVTFPEAPNEADPANVLRLSPEAKGSYAWLSPRTLVFQPDFPGLARGATYTVIVPARPEAGLPDEVRSKFTVTGKLTVQQVIPGDGDSEVPLNAQVLVQFSRSVAPLTTLAARPTDQVVTFEPALHGTGEWLNTSIYRFVPSDLAPNTRYTMTIAKGLTAATDGVLESDYRSTFTTVTPAVDSIIPDTSWTYAGPWQQVVVTFNQPMDPAAGDGVTVATEAGTLAREARSWNDTRTVLTLTPLERLASQTSYVVSAPAGLKGARGGATSERRASTFKTVGLPHVQATNPPDGATNASQYGANIAFTQPMDQESLEGKVSVSGFTPADLEGNIFISDQSIGISLPFKPSTHYTITIAAGAKDRYGQLMDAYSFSFTTGALPSSVQLALPNYQAATFSSSTEPFVWFQTTNLADVAFALYPLTPSEAKSVMFDFTSGPNFKPSLPALREWHETIPVAKDEALLDRTSLTGGGPLPKGFYLLTAGGQYISRVPIAVVDTEITTKMSFDELVTWVVDHDTGRPVEGVTVHAVGGVVGPNDAVTDARGLASFKLPVPGPGQYADRGSWITIDGDRFGVMSTRWNGTSGYQYGLPGEYSARQYVGQVYTDRPLYRPGETVFYKGVVRADDDASYSVPPADASFEFVLRNSRGQELQRQTMHLSEFGSFDGSYVMPSDAPTGDYYFSIQVPNATPNGYVFASNSFLVAEFRKPEFQVSLGTDRTSYTNGDTIAVSANASFFFGGALQGASVQWSAIASPYVMRVKGFESYSFSDIDYANRSVPKDATRAKGSGTTGADGTATFSVPAVLNASEGVQRFTISATITDQNGQAVAGSTDVTVHPAALYAGVRADRYVVSSGNAATIQLVSVDTDGNIRAGQRVTVRVYDRQWITTKVLVPGGGRRYQSDPRDTLLDTLSATTRDDGTAYVTYVPSKSGQLRIVAEVTDTQGRSSRSSTWLWVAGQQFALWQVTNDDAIKLVADKERYEVGDTADVLVPAPFAGATALITVERGKIITREVRTLATNSERLAIPIDDHSVPDVFVSVVLYRAPTAADPLPRYKVGYVELPVSTASRQLNVQITPDRAQAKPGDTVHYDIAVTDANGRPVRAELSVAVVDKAILALQDERGPDGLKAFWFERGLGVSTTSSLTTSLDRWNDAIAELPKGGKGGSGSGLPGDRIRETFRNTAYWEAQLVTSDDGHANVDVVMPDDLTTWHMAVRAISGNTMVGEGQNELVSTKPVLIRSALPRFLRTGDTADLRVLVRNGTPAAADITVAMAADGVGVSGSLTQTHTVAAGASVAYVWSATDPAEGTVKLAFTATGPGGEGDALAVSLPSLIDMTPETMSTNGVVTNSSGAEGIYLPKFADQTHGSLTVDVRSALVGSLADELGFYPVREYEGAEYVASRFLATIAVARAEQSASSTRPYGSALARDLGGLIGRQRPDGGWAWCDDPLCQSDPNVTGWVLLALGEARRDGMRVDQAVVSKATSYVLGRLNVPNTTVEGTTNDQDQRAFLLAAAAAAGGDVQSRANSLLEQDRTRLLNWGRAYLVNAFLDTGVKPEDQRVRMLVNDLNSSTIPSANGNHWEDSATSSKMSFMTSASTTALVALALARTQPDHELLAQTVRWLVVARSAQGWQTTIDRALAMLALSSYAVHTGELGGEYSYKVLLDDRQVLAGLVKPARTPTVASTKISLTQLVPGRTSILALTRDSAISGRMYYTLDLRYMTPANTVDALNRGFAISHQYTLLDAPGTPVTSVKLGEVVRVTLTVLVPNDRNYVTVEDMLPAGLEPVDARLKTTDPGLIAKLEQDRMAAAQRHDGGYVAPWFRWYYSPWQHVDQRDDRTVLVADRLTKGVYEYVYYARATTTGDFFVAPAHAEETYFPEVFGRSDSGRFTVSE
ncbi:MAG TPA: Ig-like domain-containing protein [Candidatus Limnocylindria bacterium]